MVSRFDFILSELSHTLLQEGVNFSVDEDEVPTTVYDIGSTIFFAPVTYQFIEKNLPPEVRKAMVHEYLALDGDSDMGSTEGVLNFYTRGIPDNVLPTMLSFIKYHIGENNGVVGDISKDRSKMYDSEVYRIHVKVDNTKVKNPPSFNLGNATARAILSTILNYPSETIDEYPPLNARELLMKIEQIEDNDFIIQKAIVPSTQDGIMYDSGLSEERIKRVLGYLKTLAQYAVDNDLTNVNLS